MFLLKKLVASTLFPLPFSLALILAGWILWRRGRRPRWGQGLVAAGWIVLFVASLPPVGRILLTTVETRYAPWQAPATGAAPTTVVVLGGGVSADTSWPLNSRLDEGMLARVMEGARICRARPGSRLVISLGMSTDIDRARLAPAFADLLGLAPDGVTIMPPARDTNQEAEHARRTLGLRSCVLVTSASHLPRAARIFRAASLEVSPAPCSPRHQQMHATSLYHYFPNSAGLGGTERTVYEWMGLAWNWLTS